MPTPVKDPPVPAAKPIVPAPKAPPPTSATPAIPPDEGADNPFDAMDAKLKKASEPPVPPIAPEPPEPSADSGKRAALGKEDRTASTGIKALREQRETAVAEAKALKASQTELTAKIAEYERKGIDSTALTERLTAVEKEREDARAELRALKQESSPDFKAKYDKPFSQAAEFARRTIEQLIVTDTAGASRAATWDDFAQLYKMPYNKAIALANELFGDAAPIVVQNLTKLQELDFQRQQGLEEERAGFAEKSKTELAEQARSNEMIAAAWVKVNKDIAEKHSDWYQEDPADKEGNEILKEGYNLVDSAFNRKALTPAQRIVLDANIRHRAAGFGRIVHRLNKAREEVAALKVTIEEMKSSSPGPTQRGGGGQPAAEKDFETDMREALK